MQCKPVSERKAEKLYRKICMGQEALDKGLWPILVLTKPDDIIANSQTWLDNLNFIRFVNWVSVFDFDDCSYENGIFGGIFPKAKATVTNEEKFKFVEDVSELRKELQLPEKVVWIFSNGRKELCKPHKDRKEWNIEYSSGIKGAVNFFRQRSVIPENRAIVMLFLLSDDFAGVIETLYELVSHFGWKPIVIITDRQETFDKFKHVVESERSYCQTELESSSVVGLSWKEVCSVFEDAMGKEIDVDCKVPLSSGALLTLDSRFLDQLRDITILSASVCENKKFQKGEKKSFDHKMEMKFYQGSRVDWWNFYFPKHVMKRHCFASLRHKVYVALTSPRSDQQKIITISIIHEPGAGGSTLARHILWEFRKEFKCAILERLTDKTCDDIFDLWKIHESDLKSVNPVLVLVDELSQADVSLNDLYRKIHFMYLEQRLVLKTALPVCVLLKCRKENDLLTLHTHNKMNEDVTVLLKQKLVEKGSINEKEWCEQKYIEIEQTEHELGLAKYAPEHLIAFMILRSNFNMVLISNTIESLLKDIDPESNELKLLKYTSLLFSYVESYNEALDIHIPLECCDKLMLNTNILNAPSPRDRRWEYLLSEPVKILLRIEDKRNGSGRQIKMAHPNLARQVLICIRNKTNQSTTEITLEYLKSDLLNNFSYAKGLIEEMTKEMLIRRRKEEYSDSKTTKFSPLVHDMFDEKSDKEVPDVLALAYAQLKDGMIAQQIARVYIYLKEFEKAKTWADTARSTAPQRSDFIHTCGQVMKEKFSYLSRKTNDISPNLPNQISVINTAFQAIQAFNNGIVLIMQRENADNLFIYADTLEIILQLVTFITENVETFSKRDVLHNYLVLPDFIPVELPKDWEPFHKIFKSLYEMCESAIRHLEDLIFCHTTVYDRKDFHTKERKEHRSNTHLKKTLPGMLIRFSEVFGEREQKMEEEYLINPDLRNRWYRRKLLGMKANSFIQIFNIVTSIKTKKLSKPEATQKLLEAKKYLEEITPLTDCDLANKISINVALALLQARNRDSTRKVFAFCMELINMNGKFLNIAYFFIMIILWPNKDDLDGVKYDDKLFHKALRALGEIYNTKKEQMQAGKSEVSKFKQEHNVFRATTQFFLTRGKGLRSVCHRSELFVKDTADLSLDEFYPPPQLNLMLQHGVVSSSNGNCIFVTNNILKQVKIKIRKNNKQSSFISEEQVTFYLGFSLEGLVAYSVKAIRDHNMSRSMYPTYKDYGDIPKEQLKKKLRKIQQIKEKKDNNEHLYQDEQQLLEEEEDIKEALLPLEEQFD